ncbi:nucleoside hydrolase [Diaminobutyricibacter tongyongensis]|uniref:Nucleoside hydrolase n=1 Tax=Leifsonia tongyongensis TaxID=1268043 RepID=A0A6L9XW89_9MICO|nr:nucleoside hydrolase [Diaminobutyricibacter tongyongensis]NEN05477.1 nucleoside hydrolase [Diaminobutyricibacter tongyongensis]
MADQRIRVIIDNDYSGDPDGLVQLAHHLLSPSVDIRAVIGSHLRPGDPFDPSDRTADNACDRIRDVIVALGMVADAPPIAVGSNTGLVDRTTPIASAGARAIVDEAMRDDDRSLYVCCGAGLTELASAWLLEPRIADRLTLVWIGGLEDPALAVPPPVADPVEYNQNIDVVAAQVVFNESRIPIWQVPRNAYRQALVSNAEAGMRIRPHGAIGSLLCDSIDRVADLAGRHGLPLGETYVYGDSPLVLLTALQSSFQPDPSSSEYAVRPAPRIRDDGTADFGAGDFGAGAGSGGVGRPIRVYTRLDLRLMFEDLFAKLAATARR